MRFACRGWFQRRDRPPQAGKLRTQRTAENWATAGDLPKRGTPRGRRKQGRLRRVSVSCRHPDRSGGVSPRAVDLGPWTRDFGLPLRSAFRICYSAKWRSAASLQSTSRVPRWEELGFWTAFAGPHWAGFDMDYSCLAVPAEVGYRYPESGAGAVMSRQANRADSFPSVREAPGPARASRSPRPTPQETRKIALYPQNLEGEV